MESRISVDSKGRKAVANVCAEPCAIEKGLRLIGGKWKGSLIFHLKDGPVRFNDLARMLGGASKKMIDQRLKELEAEGMVVRKVISDRPIAVSYELTEFGRTALKIFFKQKTAYEIRACDWSSDVCSSDLRRWSIIFLLAPPSMRAKSLKRTGPSFK